MMKNVSLSGSWVVEKYIAYKYMPTCEHICNLTHIRWKMFGENFLGGNFLNSDSPALDTFFSVRFIAELECSIAASNYSS